MKVYQHNRTSLFEYILVSTVYFHLTLSNEYQQECNHLLWLSGTYLRRSNQIKDTKQGPIALLNWTFKTAYWNSLALFHVFLDIKIKCSWFSSCLDHRKKMIFECFEIEMLCAFNNWCNKTVFYKLRIIAKSLNWAFWK